MGRRPREGGRRRGGTAGGGADTRPRLRLRAAVQGPVPLRRVQHGDKARARRLGRHSRHLLPDVGGGDARRNRLRVPGERERRAVRDAHQRVRERERGAGAAVLPLVRPHRRLPQLHHPLEPAQHHLLGGRRAGEGVQEPRGLRRALPRRAADEGAREPVERRLLGDAGRAGQDQLDPRAVRRVVSGLRVQRVQRVLRRPAELHVAVAGRQRRPVDGPAARPRRRARGRVGAGELHDLRLLPRPVAVPAGPAGGVQP